MLPPPRSAPRHPARPRSLTAARGLVVAGPIIEAQIPLNPTPDNADASATNPAVRGKDDCRLTSCVTWKEAGTGIRTVFAKLTEGVDTRLNTRVLSVEVLPEAPAGGGARTQAGTREHFGGLRVADEHGNVEHVSRVIFACPCQPAGNMLKREHAPRATALLNTVINVPEYADDHHPATGHMHAVMHSDPSVIDPRYREDFLRRGSNYVEVTGTYNRVNDPAINIENQYNFGVQTPGGGAGTPGGVYDMPLEKKPVMLISHALGEGKVIDKSTIRGGGNHARAHPLYSGWNVMAQLSLRLSQGRDGVYFCSNWTTPGNCHDMSLLSGMLCAHAVGAPYPFPEAPEAKKDFHRLNDLMGVF